MKTEHDVQATAEQKKPPLEVIRITSETSGCEPDNNPARPKKKRGRVKFKNKTDGAIVITLDREIFQEKGNPYTIAARKDDTYHIDESVVVEGDSVCYEVEGSDCTDSESDSKVVVLRATLRSPRMIIE